MKRFVGVAAIILVALAACQKAPPKDSNAQFDALVEDFTKSYFAEMPEMATYLGAPADLAPGADARLNDRSQEADAARRKKMEDWLARLRASDDSALDAHHRLIRDILITYLDGALTPARVVGYGEIFDVYGSWFTPYVVIQNSAAIVDVPNIMTAQQKVATKEDAENYLSRLSAYAPMIDDLIAKMQHDAGLGVVPPDFIIEKTQNVLKGFKADSAAQNPLSTSFAKKLADAKVDGADDYVARANDLIANKVYPAAQKLDDYLGELKKNATHDAGLWRLPHGAELYQAMIREMTDTDMTADEIHEIGLKEVDRITAEMDAILKAQGYAGGTVGERMTALGKEPRFFYPNTDEGRAELLADINAQLTRIKGLLPQWFGVLPKYPLEVRRIPVFSQDSAPRGYYDNSAADGSAPGIYWINLRDTAALPKFSLPTLTYHETIPGHHLQTAIAMAQKDPLILSAIYSNAYAEGWALYSEALVAEMGLYADDPFANLGRLRDELHRAVRFVVDTGLNAKKWSREQAIDYMVKTEGAEPSDAASEIERYVVWPGQALGYKIGMLKIEELRKHAEEELGDKFDIRGFHDAVLTKGSVPLPILEKNVDAWIEKTKAS
ncbi:MAG TPA: DUF885 domain-containing protein [Parvularculaceae bacterium]|nr:DUF885 domain-containing protein [Parvularculaceae bacterium]